MKTMKDEKSGVIFSYRISMRVRLTHPPGGSKFVFLAGGEMF